MIVVDTNVLVYFWLSHARTAESKAALERDPAWVAPSFWRIEFRNVLANFIKAKRLRLKGAVEVHGRAIAMMQGAEFDILGERVLELVDDSGCSAYDCEFVALAKELDVPLVTADRRVVHAFPDFTISLSDFAAG